MLFRKRNLTLLIKENFCASYRWVSRIAVAIAVCIFVTQSFSVPPAKAQEDCGECPKPLVELLDLEVGTIDAEVISPLKKLCEQYGFFDADAILIESLYRGFEYLELKKINPCADLYYIQETILGGRRGIQQGEAKYNIRTKLNIYRAQPGEKARVIRVVYDEKGNVISEKADFVPKLGTIHLRHELICLKNNETYDEGNLKISWIPDPPRNEGWYREDEGLIFGGFSKGEIADEIFFNHGDVGKTIKNKETPSSFSLDVEEEPLYPPYYQLKIHSIRNLLGEALPNKIFVALRARYGQIEGGKKMHDWSVFPTEMGKIQSPVLYRVPQCSQTKQDMIEIAAYCDWHAGEAMVGKPRASQKVHIPECFDLSLTISNTETYLHEKKTKVDQPYFFSHEKDVSETFFEASVFVTFKKDPKSIRFVSRDMIRYVYEVESWEVGTQNVFSRGQRDLTEGGPIGISYENHRQDYWKGFIQGLNLLGHGELIFIYDRKKKKIIEVENIPAFDPYLRWHYERRSRTYTPERGWRHDDKTEQFEEWHGFIGLIIKSIKEHAISGDGQRSLVGYIRNEKITPPTQEDQFTTVSGRTLEMMRWELRKR